MADWMPEVDPPSTAGRISPSATTTQPLSKIEDIPPVESFAFAATAFIEPDVLRAGAVTALTGDSECGKSTLAFAIARRAGKAGRHVLVLDRENGIDIVKDRCKRLGITTGAGFHVWGGWLKNAPSAPGAGMVLEWVARCDPRPVVVIDSLSAFFEGNQNDADAMRSFMNQTRQLADLGAAVIVIHHGGKAETSKTYRGSSDFKASIDVGFHVSNVSNDALLDRLILKRFKSRFGFSGDILYRYNEGRCERDTNPRTLLRTISEQFTEILRENPGIATQEFCDLAVEAGLNRGRARRFLDDGVQSGAVERKPGRHNRQNHFLVKKTAVLRRL